MRVQARVLSAGDYVRLEWRRVLLDTVEECSDRPGYLLLRGTYFRPPDFSQQVPLIKIVRETTKINRFDGRS